MHVGGACTAVWWNTAEVWDSKGWKVQPMAPIPQVPNGQVSSEITRVSCLGAGACVGVGWHGVNALAERRG